MIEWPGRKPGLALALALVFTAAAPLLGVSASEESAGEGRDHDRAEQARRSGEIRPLEEIAAVVRERFPGEIAKIELEREHGLWIYEFKVIDRTGRFLEIKIDARTGEIAAVEGE